MRRITKVQAKQLIANGKKKVIKKKNTYYTIAKDTAYISRDNNINQLNTNRR